MQKQKIKSPRFSVGADRVFAGGGAGSRRGSSMAVQAWTDSCLRRRLSSQTPVSIRPGGRRLRAPRPTLLHRSRHSPPLSVGAPEDRRIHPISRRGMGRGPCRTQPPIGPGNGLTAAR